MKISETQIENKNQWLKITDFENLFKIYEDDNLNYRYNLNETLYLNVDPQTYEYYNVTHDMFWPLISYNIYGTTRLAWLLMKTNNVTAKNIFNKVRAGKVVKYINKDVVENIVAKVNGV